MDHDRLSLPRLTHAVSANRSNEPTVRQSSSPMSGQPPSQSHPMSARTPPSSQNVSHIAERHALLHAQTHAHIPFSVPSAPFAVPAPPPSQLPLRHTSDLPPPLRSHPATTNRRMSVADLAAVSMPPATLSPYDRQQQPQSLNPNSLSPRALSAKSPAPMPRTSASPRHQTPPTADPGISKPKKLHREVEQKRRMRMSEQITQLRQWVSNPNGGKTDKVSVLQDAVAYVKESSSVNKHLRQENARLQAENVQLRSIIASTHPHLLPPQQPAVAPSPVDQQHPIMLPPPWGVSPVPANTSLISTAPAQSHNAAAAAAAAAVAAATAATATVPESPSIMPGVAVGSAATNVGRPYRDARLLSSAAGGRAMANTHMDMLQGGAEGSAGGALKSASAVPAGAQAMAWEPGGGASLSRTLSAPIRGVIRNQSYPDGVASTSALAHQRGSRGGGGSSGDNVAGDVSSPVTAGGISYRSGSGGRRMAGNSGAIAEHQHHDNEDDIAKGGSYNPVVKASDELNRCDGDK